MLLSEVKDIDVENNGDSINLLDVKVTEEYRKKYKIITLETPLRDGQYVIQLDEYEED